MGGLCVGVCVSGWGSWGETHPVGPERPPCILAVACVLPVWRISLHPVPCLLCPPQKEPERFHVCWSSISWGGRTYVSLCVRLCIFPPSYLLIILGRAREREIEVDVCFGTRQDVSVCSPKLCEYSALKYSLPLRLQTISCPKGLHGPPWPNILIPLTATGNWNFQLGGFRAWMVGERVKEYKKEKRKEQKCKLNPAANIWEIFLQAIICLFPPKPNCHNN